MKKRTLLKTLGLATVAMLVAGCDFSFGVETSSREIINSGGYVKTESINSVADLNVARGKKSFVPKGKKNILVLPITIKGYERNATESTKENIEKTFFGDANVTGWNSVSSFYYKSSYGQLELSGMVADWYECGYTVDEIVNLGNEDEAVGTRTILNAAVEAYKTANNTDCSEFDNDGDGYIDGVWMVYSAPNYTNDSKLSKNTYWAYTYWNGGVPNVESPVANAFCWGSYDFMYEGYGIFKLDAHTYIHETGHMIGAEDYYDYNNQVCPMGCIDMMDYNIIDHNAFTKFEMGWVKPYVITEPGQLTIRPSQSTGDCVLIPTQKGWNGSVFDEYILLEFYSPTGLNLKDSTTRYMGYPLGFSEYGVRIYHVDARLAAVDAAGNANYTETISADTDHYTDLAHTNTPYYKDQETGVEYQSRNLMNKDYRLIQEMDCTNKRNFGMKNVNNIANNYTLFQTGDVFSFEAYSDSFANAKTMNNGSVFDWYVSFDKMSSTGIDITFSHEALEVTPNE